MLGLTGLPRATALMLFKKDLLHKEVDHNFDVMVDVY